MFSIHIRDLPSCAYARCSEKYSYSALPFCASSMPVLRGAAPRVKEGWYKGRFHACRLNSWPNLYLIFLISSCALPNTTQCVCWYEKKQTMPGRCALIRAAEDAFTALVKNVANNFGSKLVFYLV